jgi:hypothetical protein
MNCTLYATSKKIIKNILQLSEINSFVHWCEGDDQAGRSHQPTGWPVMLLYSSWSRKLLTFQSNSTAPYATYTAVVWSIDPTKWQSAGLHSSVGTLDATTDPDDNRHCTCMHGPSMSYRMKRWLIITKLLLSFDPWHGHHHTKNGTWKESKWNGTYIRKYAQAKKVPETLAEGLTFLRICTFYRPLLDWAESVVG